MTNLKRLLIGFSSGVFGIGVLWSCSSDQPKETTGKALQAITTAPPASEFVVLAKHGASFGDRSLLAGGHVGVRPSGTSALNTMTAGFDSRTVIGREILAPQVVLRDRAATGNLNATQIVAPIATTGLRSPFVSPPPVPVPAAVSPGTANVNVAISQTTTLAAGSFAAVTVGSRGTLNLSGGVYQFSSLRLDPDARVIAVGASTVRIAGTLVAADRTELATPTRQSPANLRIESSGVVAGSTNGITLGNDARLTAVVVALRGFQTGDRFTATGTIAAEDVTLGIDAKLAFDNSVQPNACTATTPNGTSCFDGNRCTLNDTCQNGVCVAGAAMTCPAPDVCHTAGTCAPATGVCSTPNAPNGTLCSDSNACTTGDTCQAGSCTGTPRTCTALDSCHDVGVCDRSSGTCSQPLKPGVTCSGIAVPAVTLPAPSTPGLPPRELIGFNPAAGTLSIAASTFAALDGKGTISVPALAGANETALADVNNDGGPDLVFANSAQRKLSLLRRVDPQFPLYDQAHIVTIDALTPVLATAGPIASGDVDEDGDVDLVTSFSAVEPDGATVSTAYLYLNQNFGQSFQRVQLPLSFAFNVQLAGKALADFTGDGRIDLALFAAKITDANAAQVYVFPNTGTGSRFSDTSRIPLPLTEVLMSPTGANWGALTATDIDGDRLSDLVALGNRGGIFAWPSLGSSTFGDPEFRGAVSGLGTKWDIDIRDIIGPDGLPDLDGVPDIIIGGRRVIPDPEPPPIKIFPGRPNGIPIRLPNTNPFGTIPISEAHLNFFPVVPPGSTTQVVGLLRGSPLVTSYVDDLGVQQPSVLIRSITGHLLEWFEGTTVTTTFVVDDTIPPFNLNGPSLRPIACSEVLGWCQDFQNDIHLLTLKRKRVETRTSFRTWVDHGTPPGTFVDSEPAAAITFANGRPGRLIFVKGLDGHLWELQQISRSGISPGVETWIDRGLPPPGTPGGDFLLPGPGVVMPIVGTPSVIMSSSSANTPVAQVFVTDAGGRLDRWQEETGAWTTLGQLGSNDRDTCFVAPGALGNGGPKAIAWRGDNGGFRVNVFVTTALGDLTSWRDNAWEEPLGYYSQFRGLFPPRDGVASTLPGEFQGPGGTKRCPNLLGGFVGLDRWPPLLGTPDAVVFREGGQLRRHVFARGGEGFIMEYRWNGDTPAVPMSISKDYQFDSLARFRARADVIRGNLPKASANGALKPIASDPVIVQDALGALHVVAKDSENQLTVFHPSTTPNVRWDVFRDAFPNSENRLIAGTPGAIAGTTFTIFALRSNGILGTGPDTRGGTFALSDRPPASPPIVRDNREAVDIGCKTGGITGEQIFPQWRPVQGQRTLTPAQFDQIYTTPPAFDQGYESERLASVQGTVMSGHISALDNPFNHTLGPQTERPRTHHDYNINVALDLDSQAMLSDANIEDGGLMEIEWQQQPDMLDVGALPVAGDRVAFRGRYIYDCGHPPFRTEIHSPDAMAVMHGSRGVLRFSRHGGPVWYQPSDRNLTQPVQSCDTDGTLAHNLAVQPDSVKVKEVLWAAGTCVRNLGANFELIKPENMCYRNYEHSSVDLLGNDVPLVFDIPLPPGGSGEPRVVSPPGGPPLVDRIPVTTFFEALPTPHMHVVVPPTAFPANPTTIPFEAVWGSTPPPATRRFAVEVKVLPVRRHDNMSTGDVEGFFIETALWLAGFSDISCESDDDDELVVYASINNRIVKIPKETNTTGPVLVDLRADETLQISTGGFECDLSCGERWDDEFTESPNDRIGTARMAFTGPGFGASPTQVYRVHSQADLATPRSRDVSRKDYQIEVTIREQ